MESKKVLIGAFVGLLILMSFGCKSTPAPSASTPHVGMDLDAAIREAAIQMEARVPSGTMVALVSVASPSTAFSTQVLTRLESVVVSNGKLVVVDRANLDKVRAEQGFQLSGEVSDESAKAIGQLLGAGAIVTGSLTDLGDVYSLTLKAINIETATVAVSYLADLAKTTRIETLLATRDGAGSGGTPTATASRPASTAQTVTAQPTTPAAPVQYTVTFNANGASGAAPSAQTVQNGESITLPDTGTMTSSIGTFGGWNTRADGNGTSYTAGYTFIVNANIQLFARWVEHVYRIGDTGPAGGIVFFDKGNRTGGWRYLEAAPYDIDRPLIAARELFEPRTDRSVGSGKLNTQAIMNEANNRGGGFGWAAQACDALVVSGFDDWFLPSRDELNFMYGNLHLRGLGNFRSDNYWSSTFSGNWNNNQFTVINFSSGEHQNPFSTSQYRVRAIRQF